MGTLKMLDRKMQDWNLEDNFAGLENAGLSKAALCTIKGDESDKE